MITHEDKKLYLLCGTIILSALILGASIMVSFGPKVAWNNHPVFSLKGTTGSQQPVAPFQPSTINQGAKTNVAQDNDPVLGLANAKVTIIEFSDFQCPFCRSFWQNTLAQLKSEYIDTGKVKLVYRDFPLSFHPAAQPSAEAAECANEQGRFWQMHDKIFGEQSKSGQGTVQFGVTEIKRWANEVGLNMSQFNTCFDSGKYKAEVQKDFADGQAAGVSGTPTFFVNGQKIVGAQPLASFKSLIDQELTK